MCVPQKFTGRRISGSVDQCSRTKSAGSSQAKGQWGLWDNDQAQGTCSSWILCGHERLAEDSRDPVVTPVSCPGPVSPGHADLRHVPAAGPQGCLEHDGALPLCLCGHGHHVGKELGQASAPAQAPSPGDWEKLVWAPRRPLLRGNRAWPSILAMFLPLGPSPTHLLRTCWGHP